MTFDEVISKWNPKHRSAVNDILFCLKESNGERIMKKFAQQLKELREYYGMTQNKVAECLNFSLAAISNYECGAREPGIGEMVLLANFFKVSLDYSKRKIASTLTF